MEKVIFCVVLCSLLAGTVSALCKVDPKREMTWDRSFVCDTADAYPHGLVEWALEYDLEAQSFLDHASAAFDTVAEKEIIIRNTWYCEDVCPETLNNLTAVYHPLNQEICHVVRPWQQRILYVGCGTKTCQISNSYSPNYYCVPDGFIQREVLVYCPYMLPQCQRISIKVPTACSCKTYFCNNRMSLRRGGKSLHGF
ncbi:hypothetical protein ScPMuIL_013006 [Solemya velum]